MSTDASTSSTSGTSSTGTSTTSTTTSTVPDAAFVRAFARAGSAQGPLVFSLRNDLTPAERWATVVVWLQFTAARAAPVTQLTPGMIGRIRELAEAHPNGEFHHEVLHTGQHWLLEGATWADNFFALTAPAPQDPLSGDRAWAALHQHPPRGASTRLALVGPDGATEPFGTCAVNAGIQVRDPEQPPPRGRNEVPPPPRMLPTDHTSFYLLDPRLGLFRFEVKTSRADFVARMQESALSGTPFRSYIVDDPPVRKPAEEHRTWLVRCRERLTMADTNQPMLPLVFHEETLPGYAGQVETELEPYPFWHYNLRLGGHLDDRSIWRFTSRPHFESVVIGAGQTYDDIRARIEDHSAGDKKVDEVRSLSFCRNPAALMGTARARGGDLKVSNIIDHAAYLVRIDVSTLEARGVTGHPALGRAISVFETEYVLVRTPGEVPLPLVSLASAIYRNPFRNHQMRAIATLDGSDLTAPMPKQGDGRPIERIHTLLKLARSTAVEPEQVDAVAVPRGFKAAVERAAVAIEKRATPMAATVRGDARLRKDAAHGGAVRGTRAALARIATDYSKPLWDELGGGS